MRSRTTGSRDRKTEEMGLYLVLLTEVNSEHLWVALRPFHPVKSRPGGDGLLCAAVLNKRRRAGASEEAATASKSFVRCSDLP